MELSNVVFLSLVLCGMENVHAHDSLAKLTTRVRVVEHDLRAWKFSSIETETKLMNKFKVWEESLKEELTSSFLPSLIQLLLKQAITNIMKDNYIGNMISGQVLDEVTNLNTRVQNLTTKLDAVTQELRRVERERDTYRESVAKERGELTKDIRALQLQVNLTAARATSCARMLRSKLSQTIAHLFDTNQTLGGFTQDFRTLTTRCVVSGKEIESYLEGLHEMQRNVSADIQCLNIQLNQTIGDLFDTNQTLTGLTQDFRALNTSCCGMGIEIKDQSTTTFPALTEASTVPTPTNTVTPEPETTQDLQASTTDANEDLTSSKTEAPVPVTTQVSDPNATSPATDADLYSASEDGDLKSVKRILTAGHVDINTRGYLSRTPLLVAAYRGHSDVVEFLVGRGADVSAVDWYGASILHMACWGGDLETVKLILSLDLVDINVKNSYGLTATDYARDWEHPQVLDLLVSRGGHFSELFLDT